MARKKLNKKVALIGSVVFMVFAVAVIGIILHLSRDPQKFIEDGDAAWKAKDYERAEHSYHKARSKAKTDELRIEVLFRLVDFYIDTDKWNFVRGCWDSIIKLDSKNIKARYGRLRYFYIMADSGVYGAWKQVYEQASEFLEIVNPELLSEDVSKWETFEMQQGTPANKFGAYLYLLKGRAMLEMVAMREVSDADESLAQAIDDLEKAQELEPGNVEIYWYLARAALVKGDILVSRGDLEARSETGKEALELLEGAIEVAGDTSEVNINILRVKSSLARGDIEQFKAFETEYLALTEKFSSDAAVYANLCGYYQDIIPGHKYIDNAVEAIEKAIELDKENVGYARIAANLYYRRFSIFSSQHKAIKQDLHKAIEFAKNALELPESQETKGPREFANRRNRIMLWQFLANCYIEQILEPYEPLTESESKQWLANAEEAVHEIEQLYGSGEEPVVILWQGMLELAQGNKNNAVRKLYAVYEQFKASDRYTGERLDIQSARLAYNLAKIFNNSSEVGAVAEFVSSAISAGIRGEKPEALLDLVRIMFVARRYNEVLDVINVFEESYWSNLQTQSIRIRTYIAAKQFDKAEEELALLTQTSDDPNMIELQIVLLEAKINELQRAFAQSQLEEGIEAPLAVEQDQEEQKPDELTMAEVKGYVEAKVKLIEKLLSIEPNLVRASSVIGICDDYIREGKAIQAEPIVDKFLEHFPNDTTVLFYKQLLSLPEIAEKTLPLERRKEIENDVILNISDASNKAMSLGLFYRKYNEPNKAIVEFEKVLKIEPSQSGSFDTSVFDEGEVPDMHRIAAENIFELAIQVQNWDLASAISNLARRNNLDECEGNFFAARFAESKGDYKEALARLNECLEQRPVFSYGFMRRSVVNMALGNDLVAVEDARKAFSLNFVDGMISKVLANALYQRNIKLGDNVTADQMLETKEALIRAMSLNPREWNLQSLYAEYISAEQPQEALAMRQRLLKLFPNVQNALLLGNMAIRMAQQQADDSSKQALFDIAETAFEQAVAMEPQNTEVLNRYSEYLRITDQKEKAEEIVKQAQDPKSLWRYYFRAGQFEDANEVLEQLYKSEPKDTDTIRGLLLVAETGFDAEAVKKYSEELISLEDNIENRLIQIQIFLSIGLTKEAEYKLQSFKERFPNEPRGILLEALLAMKQGRLEEGLELINQVLQAEQDNVLAWRFRGQINLLMGNHGQAIIDLERSRQLSDSPDTQLILARAYLQAKRYEDAITELKNMIEDIRVTKGARELLEQTYYQLGRKEDLKKFYDETLQKFPENMFWHNRAANFAQLTGDIDSAEQLYDKSRKIGKGSKGEAQEAFRGYLKALLIGAGTPDSTQGDWNPRKLDKVFEEGGKHIDDDFAPIAFIAMAEAKLRLGDRATAIKYCQTAVDKTPTNEDLASWVLSAVYSLLGVEETTLICEEKLQSEPDSIAANFTMYNLARIKEDYNKAVTYIDKCIKAIGTDSPQNINFVMQKATVLQLAYNKTSDNSYLKRVITEYESLLSEMPNNVSVLNNIAMALASNDERLAEALGYAERAYESAQNNPGVVDTYAYVLYKNGKYQEAVEFLHSALQLFEQNKFSVPWEVYEHLGQIQEKLKAKDRAYTAYKQALEAGGDGLPEDAKTRINAAIEGLAD